MLVVSSPSGAGKTTLTRNLLEEEENVSSVDFGTTTRAPAPSEIDGVHYQFISKREFEMMRDAGELLEWAEVHGNFYGTPREPVETALDRRPRRAVRHRLAGHAAALRDHARRRGQRIRAAADRGRN